MCGPKMKLGREWGKLSNEEFHDLILFHQIFVRRSKQENGEWMDV